MPEGPPSPLPGALQLSPAEQYRLIDLMAAALGHLYQLRCTCHAWTPSSQITSVELHLDRAEDNLQAVLRLLRDLRLIPLPLLPPGPARGDGQRAEGRPHD